MSVFLKGVAPTASIWNNGTQDTDLGNQNSVVAQVVPGTSLHFQCYNSWYPGFNYTRDNSAIAVGTVVVNPTFTIDAGNIAATNYTIFTNVGSSVTLSPTYTDTLTEIEVLNHNDPWGLGAYPKSERTDTQKQLLSPIELSQTYNVGDITNVNNIISLTLNDVGTSATSSRYYDNIISLSVDGDLNLNFISNLGSYSQAIVDGDSYGLLLDDTGLSVLVNDVPVFSESRSVTYTLSGAAILDGHTLDSVSSAIPMVMTDVLNIPIDATNGIYTITATTNDGQVGIATYEVVNSSNVVNSPSNGSCWEAGEVVEIETGVGNILSIVSITPGLTGTSGGTGTPNATFTINSVTNNISNGTIQVTNSNGDVDDLVLNLCFMLPPITTTSDNPNITTDDAANQPPSSIYQCVGVTVDAIGPGFLSGDVTWSILDNTNTPVVSGVTFTGQNTATVTFSLDDTVAPGNYTLKAVETATPANFSTHSFTLVALPPITIGTNQPYVGGNTQFNTAFPFAVNWNPAEVDNDTGLATWTTAGVKTIEYVPDTVACSETLSYTVYNVIDVAEYDEINCVYINSGESLALTVTGGSGTYSFAISGQNSITAAGVITAGIYAGSYVVTITDVTANIIKSVPICIGSQSQFCTAVVDATCAITEVDPCCELSINCGESIPLSIPSFHLRINGLQEEVSYSSYGSGTTGPSGYLRSTSAAVYAAGNSVVCTESESLFEIITNLDMSDVANAAFAVGFSQIPAAGGVNTMDIAVVWHTVLGLRYVEIRKEGVLVVGSTFSISLGDVVSAGYQNGNFVLYINNLLKFETSDFQCCGTQYLDVAIEQANKSLGGYLTGLTWTIITPGTVAEVGTINASGVYNSPSNTAYSLVEAEATAGNGKFRVRIRNIKPTLKQTRPDAFLAGKAVTLWVGPYIPNMTDVIRIAKDGSPDAIQNPGMIDTGTLEGSANFQEQMEYQDFENDLGVIYNTSIIKESAQLTGTFLEVRDLYKLAQLKPEATLHSKNRGVVEMSVGGKSCEVRELRVIMVIGSPGCDTAYDVLYLPRVQNKGNLGLEVGKKTNGKYELTFTALPDYTLPPGRQLYRLFQYDTCQSDVCA